MSAKNSIREFLSELFRASELSRDQGQDDHRPLEIDDYSGITPWLDPDTNQEWEPPSTSK